MRPETRGGTGGKLAADHIYVTLANDSEVAALRQAVEGIARRHHLEVAESGASVRRFDLTYHGERTHSIHVVTPLVTRLGGRPRVPAGHGAESPRLAIIIDDLGNDRAAADSLMALPFPLTISVLPHLPLSSEKLPKRHTGAMRG